MNANVAPYTRPKAPSAPGGTPRAKAFTAIVLAGLFAFLSLGFFAPTQAQALSVKTTTARPNEDGGDHVIGGLPTRLTWEGTVDEGEELDSMTLTMAEGGTFEGSSTRVTVLDGLNRQNVDAVATADGTTLQIVFENPIPSGSLVRLEVTGVAFPNADGSYAIEGTYENELGEQALPSSPAIEVIANTPVQGLVNWLDEQPWVEAWNSNPFLNMFFKPQILVSSFASLFPGWLVCLAIVLVAYPFAIAFGLCFAFMKMSRFIVVRAIAVTYINILRGTPLFLQIYIAFFGLPMLGIQINVYILGCAVMAINSSAYLAEIFRAGIQSIPQGQYEAAASLGMGHMRTMVSIILPQTVRRVLPTVTSDFITSYKDTSLLSSVGVMELMMYAKNMTAITGNITPYMTAAIFYLIVTLPLIKAITIVEQRIARSESGQGPRPRGGEAVSAEDVELDFAHDALAQAAHAEALDEPLARQPLPLATEGA